MGGEDQFKACRQAAGRIGSSKYASERYDPTLAHCGNILLIFNGQFLAMSGGARSYNYVAASGKPEGDKFDYSLARQCLPKEGPIPQGEYWIRPDELWERAWYKFGMARGWGNYRISIHPFTTTETYSRGGFFIHGGSTLGSAGCIDLSSSMDQFTEDLRRELGNSRLCQIHLTVKYP